MHGDCIQMMRLLGEASVDAVVTDPPYGIRFMGKAWDGADIEAKVEARRAGAPLSADRKQGATGAHNSAAAEAGKYDRSLSANQAFEVWTEEWAREALRVLKPGGHLLSFSSPRTYHRMASGIEDAGFEIRDQIMWLFGCLSEDTEILVDGRWEPYQKATSGRLALCYDVEHDSYKWQPIQALHEYPYSDTAFRIVSDQTDQIVSRNHRCLVERGRGFAFQIAETLEREARVPVLEDVQALLRSVPLLQQGTSSQEQGFTSSSLARVVPFAYSGIVWCVTVPTGAFVARRNGKVFVTGNSGFPKNLNISKALAARAGAETEVPVTEEAKQGEGFGTALKPAHEPCVLARKPLVGTVVENVLACGCGGLNIDGCRVENADAGKQDRSDEGSARTRCDGSTTFKPTGGPRGGDARGRFPANVITDGSDEVRACFPDAPGQQGKVTGNEPTANGFSGSVKYSGMLGRIASAEPREEIDTNASRFFYQAKATARDRRNSKHPTVKPIALMRYLCRLVTPPGGLILDPFAGSGTTGEAAHLEGFRAILIEREAEYADDIRNRLQEIGA